MVHCHDRCFPITLFDFQLCGSKYCFLKDLVDALDGIMFNDLMENIEWFFNLHDNDKDGSLTKDELLKLSESLLVR